VVELSTLNSKFEGSNRGSADSGRDETEFFKTKSLQFYSAVFYKQKSFIKLILGGHFLDWRMETFCLKTCCQCYITFYICNLQMFVIS
jgi:hypothetical protein